MRIHSRISIVASGADGIGLSTGGDATVYLINGGSECALIDAGFGEDTRAILGEVEKDGLDVKKIKWILLTHGHADHAGGARELSAYTGAKILAMESTARAVTAGDRTFLSIDVAIEALMFPSNYVFPSCTVERFPVGKKLQVGDVTIEGIVTEGHCNGHLAYYSELDELKCLFSGDSVLYKGKISLLSTFDCSIPKYKESVARLMRYEVDGLFPSHGCFSLRGGKRHLQMASRYFEALEVPKNYNEDIH